MRPTADALREQAFAVLGHRLKDEPFLDLFAGTGAVTLEALSRGADRVLAVERSQHAAALIERNLAALSVPAARCELLRLPVHEAVTLLAKRGLSFRLAWCDPPFDAWDDGVRELTRAHGIGVLAAGAEVVLEVPPRRVVSHAAFEVVRHLRGAVLLRGIG